MIPSTKYRLSDSSLNPLSFAEESLVAIAESRGADHVLQYVNPAFCRLFGNSPSECLERPFFQIAPKGETPLVQTLMDRVFWTGIAECAVDVIGLTVDESESEGNSQRQAGYWSYMVWPVLDNERRAIGLVMQVSRVADLAPAAIEAYAVMLTANQQLVLSALHEGERAELLTLADRAKDEFLAMLAHELRNPLAAIRTGVYLVAERAQRIAPELQPKCALIERQCAHMAVLLDDLLEVSRIITGKIELRVERVDLVFVVEQVLPLTSALMEPGGHELTVEWPPGPVYVDADPNRVEQILINLIQNAAKYTDPGGHIWITVETDPGVAVNRSDGPGDAVIRVRDTGIGISPELLPHIFDLFTQSDRSLNRSQGGLGIGLTLVRRLVETHGGSVEAVSAGLGEGSEFIVRLPLKTTAKADPPVEAPSASPKTMAPSETHVLLVEDNLDAAAVLGDLLYLWGYVVEIAHSGTDALRIAEAARPDVVLLDIGLTGMDGYELARILRGQTGLSDTLLVAVTGYGQEADRRRSREAGFDYHLTKPVNLDELRSLLESGRREGR